MSILVEGNLFRLDFAFLYLAFQSTRLVENKSHPKVLQDQRVVPVLQLIVQVLNAIDEGAKNFLISRTCNLRSGIPFDKDELLPTISV